MPSVLPSPCYGVGLFESKNSSNLLPKHCRALQEKSESTWFQSPGDLSIYCLFSEALQTLSWWVFVPITGFRSIQQPSLEESYPGSVLDWEGTTCAKESHLCRERRKTRFKQWFLHELSLETHSSDLKSAAALIPGTTGQVAQYPSRCTTGGAVFTSPLLGSLFSQQVLRLSRALPQP